MIKLYQIRKIFFAPKTLEFNLEKKKRNSSYENISKFYYLLIFVKIISFCINNSRSWDFRNVIVFSSSNKFLFLFHFFPILWEFQNLTAFSSSIKSFFFPYPLGISILVYWIQIYNQLIYVFYTCIIYIL